MAPSSLLKPEMLGVFGLQPKHQRWQTMYHAPTNGDLTMINGDLMVIQEEKEKKGI